MSVTGLGSSGVGADCEICRSAASTVVSELLDPLVCSVRTMVCPDCYKINKAAADSLVSASAGRLLLREFAV